MIRTVRFQTGHHHVVGHDLDQNIYIMKLIKRNVKCYWVSNALPRGAKFDTFAQCRRAVVDHLNGAA